MAVATLVEPVTGSPNGSPTESVTELASEPVMELGHEASTTKSPVKPAPKSINKDHTKAETNSVAKALERSPNKVSYFHLPRIFLPPTPSLRSLLCLPTSLSPSLAFLSNNSFISFIFLFTYHSTVPKRGIINSLQEIAKGIRRVC
jgi:hypothetical protein